MEIQVHRKISWQRLEETHLSLIHQVQTEPHRSFLLMSEPLPTFTYGRSSSPEELLWSPEHLKEQGVSVHPVSRGGKWTYHGPGQLLIYPIVNLRSLRLTQKGAKTFVESFREGVFKALCTLSLHPQKKDTPYGIYLEDKKIASFGLAFPKGTSSHGVAIYLEPQDYFFKGIRACGVEDQAFTSLSQAGLISSWEKLISLFSDEIKKSFKSLENRLV